METPVLYDPTDPTFADRSHHIYTELRDHHPLYTDSDGRFSAISRFDDVWSATTDWHTFSSTGKAEHRYIKPTMNSLDPPGHTRMRR